ncbi:MAG: hypothetical protein MZU84_07440 [Sphingobacterium sp.]|nr:hypothetical protein [Sphingobacterium sp.]
MEDTLAGKPMKMNVDLLVLMVGFVTAEGTTKVKDMLGLEFRPNRFFKTKDQHMLTNVSNIEGVFFGVPVPARKKLLIQLRMPVRLLLQSQIILKVVILIKEILSAINKICK